MNFHFFEMWASPRYIWPRPNWFSFFFTKLIWSPRRKIFLGLFHTHTHPIGWYTGFFFHLPHVTPLKVFSSQYFHPVRFPQTTDSTRTYPISRQLGNINPLLDLVQPDLILNQTRHVGEATLLWQQLHLHRRTLQILNANTIRSDRLQQVIG